MTPFVPADFVVPLRLEQPEFVIRPLLISDVVKDYDAVMSSVDHLRGVFGPNGKWPQGLTFEDDLIDLGWHHKEFKIRRSFAYTVMSHDEALCLGCLYINPTAREGCDAEAYCWIRASHAAELDARLFETLKAWIASDWPFSKVAYPGRD
ncbi:hypothetical protein [Phenylobacterium aquaticum]|uniref:hypothetical protein n=1 Tax=Phenylobacterium aquaticum TaxID=1763816 RepID=UPI0026F23911|nr:hypothetical protein [Phenylobacterium aquaticum]